MKKLLTSLSIIVFMHYGTTQVVNCPLNTPEFPFETQDDWWGDSYSWSAGLYMPAQIGTAHTINSISFRLDNTSGAAGTFNNIQVYLRHTAVTNYASSPGYPGTAGFTLCFNGSITLGSSNGTTYTFTLSTPFAYNGTSNLEVLIQNQGGHWSSAEPWFDRTNDAGSGVFPGKCCAGSTFANATACSSNRQFNLAIFTNAVNNTFCGGYPLSVEFNQLESICDDQKTILKWSTNSETNNDFYFIEQSIDGRNWSKIAEIDGKGTTTDYSEYLIEAKNIDYVTNYYKLSQTDFDGKITELQLSSSNCNPNTEPNASPNPTNGKIVINSIEPNSNVIIKNNLGQTIYESGSTLQNDFIEIDLSEFENGIYNATISNKNSVKSIRIIKE